MAGITEIPGLDGPNLELFRAAGIDSSGKLVAMSLDELTATLREVNEEKQLVAKLPAVSAMESWQSAARIFEGNKPGEVREVNLPSNVMASTRLGGLPVAQLVPSQQLRSAGVKASAIPVGRLIEQVVGGLRLAKAGADDAEGEPEGEQIVVEKGREKGREGREKGRKRVRETHLDAPRPVLGKPVKHVKDQVAQNQGAEVSLEFPEAGDRRRMRDGMERRNHGMTHKEPMRVYIGALAALLSMFLVMVGFAAIAIALGNALYFGKPVPIEEAFTLLVFPVALVIYVAFAMRPRCRLCGQRLFLPRQCRKHQRAHRSILGYLFALAAHVLYHGWFRCMLCGTKQRLKE